MEKEEFVVVMFVEKGVSRLDELATFLTLIIIDVVDDDVDVDGEFVVGGYMNILFCNCGSKVNVMFEERVVYMEI